MSDEVKSKPLQATFYMRGGHQIVTGNVKSVSMTSNPEGGYSAYSIKWLDAAKAPNMFSLSIPDIVAVVVVEDPYQ